jgi:hypothetical protein
MTKFTRDNQVAVLYSPGYGAGWSTWAEEAERQLLLFEPDIVQLVLERDSLQITSDEFNKQVEMLWELKQYESYCSPEKLQVTWLHVGTKFRINEYDGSESIMLQQDDIWHTA